MKLNECPILEYFKNLYSLATLLHRLFLRVSFFRRNRSLGSLLTYEGLPESLKKEVFVRSKVEEDPEVLKERQDLVKSLKPSELGNIGGLSDFPLPEKLDTLMRPSKRNLKSTKKKEESKRRWVTDMGTVLTN